MRTHSPRCVIDTIILRRANALLTTEPRARSLFVRRVCLLTRIQRGDLLALYSQALLKEYAQQVLSPRNDYVRQFLALLTDGRRSLLNWKRHWSGGDREKVRKCRYPGEDVHVLRTAVCREGSTIFTEEHRMLVADGRVHREFSVHIRYLP